MWNIGLLVLRLSLGVIMAGHGAQKLFGWFGGPGIPGFGGWLDSLGIRPARPWALMAGLAEFAGGLAVAAGLVTPIAALVVAGTLLVAILVAHVPNGFWNASGGYEYPLALIAGMVAISLTGPGRFSLDSYFGIALPEPATWGIAAAAVLLGATAVLARSRTAEARRRPAVS